ncbi:hypothetical protein ACJX0J_014297, partial [Zea mays]
SNQVKSGSMDAGGKKSTCRWRGSEKCGRTRFKMHYHGWRSIYCISKRLAFKGSAPLNISGREAVYERKMKIQQDYIVQDLGGADHVTDLDHNHVAESQTTILNLNGTYFGGYDDIRLRSQTTSNLSS